MFEYITDVRYPILDTLSRSGGSMDYVALLNATTTSSPNTTHALLKVMRQDGLISGSLDAYSTVKLEPPGTALLLQLRQDAEQQRKKTAEDNAQKETDKAALIKDQKKQLRRDLLVAAFSAVISVLGTLFVEHFNEIIQWFSSLFSSAK